MHEGRPKRIERPDFQALIEAVEEYMDFVESEDYHEDSRDDYDNAIVEAAIEAMYGEKAWEHINEQTDRERDYNEEEE